MMKSSLTITALVIAGLAGSPFVASAKTSKQTKHHTSTSSTTTGANMKSSTGANASMRGNTSNQGTTKSPAPGAKY